MSKNKFLLLAKCLKLFFDTHIDIFHENIFGVEITLFCKLEMHMRKICRFSNILQNAKSYFLPISIILGLIPIKGTQNWDFFWLRFWNLYYFFVSYVKISRFNQKNFFIGQFWGEVRFFHVVLGLRGIKTVFNLGKKKFFLQHHIWPLYIG